MNAERSPHIPVRYLLGYISKSSPPIICLSSVFSFVSMDGKNMTLYWASGSPYCMRAMIALQEKGFGGYVSRLLSMSDNEHKSPEVLKVNSRGQVRKSSFSRCIKFRYYFLVIT